MRIIDANANRAREAVRVMEEAARMLLEDRDLAQRCKQLRHDLAGALTPLANAIDYRDIEHDVGTTISTDAEAARVDRCDVVIAAGKRLTEALRSIEEYAKTLADQPHTQLHQVAPTIEQLRYRAYAIEQRLVARLRRRTDPARWRVCVLLTESLVPDGNWLRVARACVEGGADCIQLREKQLDAGELLDRASQLVELAHASNVGVIVNDRPDVALAAGADGVHLGQTDLPCRSVRDMVGRAMIIGVSTSDLSHASAALADGADYCGVGPMFPTTTKHKPTLAGPAYLRDYLQWGKLAHLAIGGITPGNIGKLTAVGCRAVAVSASVLQADDPAAVVRQLRASLRKPAAAD